MGKGRKRISREDLECISASMKCNNEYSESLELLKRTEIGEFIRRKNGKERLGEIQKIAFGKGKEKPNAENLRYRKKKRGDHDF